MTKLAFFDIDGTLAAPLFLSPEGRPVVGFSDEEWVAYCEREKEASYDHCRPVPQIREYAESLKGQGATLYVLTASCGEEEDRAKDLFIGRQFPGLFHSVICVRHDREKIDVIRKEAGKAGVEMGDCELIEDTFDTVLLAHVAGVKAVHVSNILAGNISG